MQTREIRVLVALAVLVVLCGLSLGVVDQAAAGSGCPVTHTVVRGDTLGRIARRFGLSLAELIQLNRPAIRNPNLIYAGQVLCVSRATPAVVPEDLPAAPQLAIEVTYRYEPSDDERDMNGMTSRGGFIGKRAVFPLETITPVVFINDEAPGHTAEERMRTALTQVNMPTLLLVREAEGWPTYELVFIEPGPPVSSTLLISQTGMINTPPNKCPGLEVAEVLGNHGVQEAEVTVWLEAGSETRYPFQISRINRKPTVGTALGCYNQSNKIVALILAPSEQEPGAYQAHVLLKDNELGPGGAVRTIDCRRWAGKRGFWYWFLRSLARCPR